jgi:tRNA 2-thiouridine synthesizing protein A
MSGEARLVDARGLLCPWPALRLARTAREMGDKGKIRILADDPIAPRELAQLCVERGWAIASDPEEIHAFDVTIG